jgi:hypothetical protein
MLRVFSKNRSKESLSLFSIAAIAADTLINAAGLWFFIMNIPNTDLWKMLASTTYTQPTMSPLVAFIIACGFGIWLAAGPEELWVMGEGTQHGA